MARRVTGGRAAKQFILQAKRAQRGAVEELQVGFFATAKYPDGTPVTNVAVWNEFGTGRIPERPFFRQALAGREAGSEAAHAGRAAPRAGHGGRPRRSWADR